MNHHKQFCCFRTYCVLLMLAFTAATLHSNAQTVRFTINGKQNDCAPHALSFTNMSDAGSTAYLWDFGQGSTATTRDAGITYLNPGSYKVTLTVTYPGGSRQFSETIEVYARPVPQFSVSNVIGCTPLPIQFTDQSTPGSGTLQNVTWDFGDGVITSDPNPSHVYNVGGNFSINIIATNSFGCSSGLEKARLINVGETPKVDFTSDAFSSCTTPLTVNFTSTGATGLTYAWDFGNGTTSTAQNPVVAYQQEGRYTVVLKAKNTQGCEAVITKPDFVTIQKTRADFTTQGPVCTGTNVTIINTTMPRPTLSTWTLPDGRKTFGTDASYYFSAPGDYIFTLESGLPGCMETITKTITVNEAPVASFTATPPQGCSVPFNTQFTSQSIGAAEWHWTFGDGTTADGLNPTHTYTNFGSYDVSLMIKSSAGCEANVTLLDYIRIEEPIVDMFISNREGCLPHTTSFSANLRTAGVITGYSWDFGDGTTSTAANPSHTYTTEGVFNIRLVVDISGGCKYTVTDVVRAGEIPIVNFDGDPKAPCARYPVNFVNQSVPRGTEWVWFFPEDGGSTEVTENPSHVFRTIGKHDVTFTVSNYGCRRTLTKIDFITILPPIANFLIGRNCNDRYTVNFTDASDFGPIPGTPRFWAWDFGDGATSTIPSPSHVYAAPGIYTIRLTVNDGNCENVHAVTIEIIDEKPVISALNTEICAGGAVTFTRGNTNPANIVSYGWNWGDNTFSQVAGTSISKTYRTPGNYNVVLTVLDRNGCTSTSNVIPVKVNGAVADFNFSGRNCKNDDIAFTDASTASNGYNIRSWTWNFGDGTTPQVLTAKPVDHKHAFSQMGTYNVQLRIEDNAGCVTSVIKPVPVTGVTAQFRTPSTIACKNQPIQFSNTSTGSGLIYAWDFGDGSTSTQQHPVKAYPQPGEYDVTLIATNAIGCMETITKGKFVIIPDPVAKFSVPANLPVCPPVLVQFTNESSTYVRSVWDFGDGSRSSLQNPSHVFNLPGKYTIRLDVFSQGDCINSTTQEIVIQGPTGTRDMTPKIGCMPHEITLSAVSNNAVKYYWDFDNGNVQITTTPSYKYTYDKQGVYYPRVILEDAQGCKVPAQGPLDSIIVDQAKASFVLDDSKACDFGDVLFTNSSTSLSYTKHQKQQTYLWDFGIANRTDDVSTALNPRFFYNGVGTYQAKLVVTTIYGCKDSMTLPVKVEPLPDAFLNPVNPICEGDSIVFSGAENKNLPNTKWTWLLNDVANGATGAHPRIVFNTPGSNHVKLVIRNENNKCPDTARVPVTVNPLPNVNVTPKQSVICQGESLELRSNASPAVYSWTNYNISDASSANPRVSPLVDTTYRIRVVNNFGCTRTDSMRISVSHPFDIRSSDAVICSGKQTQLSANGGAVRYRWFPSTGLNRADIPNPLAKPLTTTQYQVVGYGNDACFTDTANVLVTVNPSPEIVAGPGRVVPAGTEVTLNVQGTPDIIQWQWYPNQWISCADCPSPIATPKGDVTYNISATNQYGCVSIALLPIKLVCPASTAFIPNSFSPNADGQNDIFYIRGKGISGIKSFKIFNRWGQLVFERSNCNTDDPGCGWDGKFGGVLVNPDVYIYYAEMTCDSNEPLLIKGNITVLR